jgi:chaperonin GroES
MKVKNPLHDVCIIEPYLKVVSVGGVLIPRNAEEFHEDIGKVIYCGPGKTADDGELLPMFVKPGDWVMYSTHGHQVTKLEGKELIVLRQDSIICLMEMEAEDLAAVIEPARMRVVG